MNFTELNLRAPIQRAIAEFGYTTPSPIQQKAIPPVLQGHDLIGCAQTGTGKTAAFALPMLELLAGGRRAKRGEIRALILTPTRELALQIGQNFTDYGKYTGLRHTVIFGGVGQMPQIDALKKGLDVLIACPGRLNDLSNQGFVNLNNLEIFVLDEADRMLDMGFVHDVKRVVAKLPPKRQNLMFSATMPKEIEALANTFLTNPTMVKVNPVSSTVEKIEQSLYFVEKGNKLALLIHLIKELKLANALVFSRTKHGADKIVKQLEKAGITAAAIHGNKGQTARVTALENFKAGKTKVLVATDIAARGIDINELSHVFNFDLPEVPETYVHRIGRTARAGADGVAISFCATEEKEYLQGIERLNRKKIPVVSVHPFAGKPSPVKAVTAPLRGRKPTQAENSATAPQPKTKDTTVEKRRNATATRLTDTAAGTKPQLRRKEEASMQQNDNRAQNRAAGPNQGNQQGQRDGQNRNQQNRQGGNRQGGNRQGGNAPRNASQNNQGAKPRNNAPAQPKFDPRFLTPQAAEQIPHTAPVAAASAAPEMLDVRRMNQNQNAGRDRRGRGNRNPNGQGNYASVQGTQQGNANNNQGGRNRQGGNAPARGGNDRADRNDRTNNGRGAGQTGSAQQARGDVRNDRANAGRGERFDRNDRTQQGGRNGNERTDRNAGGRNERVERNTAGRSDRAQQSGRFDRNDRNDRADRNPRGEYHERSDHGNGHSPRSAGGKVGQSGLQTVRSQKPIASNPKDPGLVLITKKPPQQKFTDFESYMSAHGGVTAPVEEYGDK